MKWLRDRLVVADPGLVRLDTAGRTTAAVALAAGILLWFVEQHNGPQVLVLVGGIASWISAIPVNDVKLSDRRITTLLIPVPVVGGLALAALTGGRPLIEDIVFLAVLFGAVYVRRFGGRWTALGIVATFGYFFGLFVGVQTAQLGPLTAAILVGMVSTYVMRFVFVPKHVQGSLYWVMEAVRSELRLVLGGLRSRPPSSTADGTTEVMVEIARVNETMLAVEEQGVIAGVYDELTFRCEVAAENVIVAAAGAKVDESARAAAEREMATLMEEVHHVVTSQAADPDSSSPQRDAILHETQKAAGALAYRLRPTTRQAIQVTLAAAVAIAVGEHISTQRWYWAVITAFVVFSGTTSAGETLTRGWAGFLGTVIGVVAGTGIGSLVQRDVVLESWVFFSCLLLTAYFLRIGLGVAWFFITLALVMLYELLGRFTETILLVRVAEVLTGVVCGGAAAFLVLPTSTRAVFRADVCAVLQALRDGIDGIATAVAVEAQAASRRVDAAVRRLRSRTRPLRSGPTFAGGSPFARHWLRNLEVCAYYARNTVCAERAGADSAALAQTIETIDALLKAIEAHPAWPYRSLALPDEAVPEYLTGPAALFLERIRSALELLVFEQTGPVTSAD